MSIDSLKTLAWNKIESFSVSTLKHLKASDSEKLIAFIKGPGKRLTEDPDSHLAQKLMTVAMVAKMRDMPLKNEPVLEEIILTQEKAILSRLIPNPENLVENGYGEFIVFYKDGKKEVPKQVFEKAYAVFCRFTPGAIAERKEEMLYANRHNFIRLEIQRIDPSLEIAFIPRTLYELIFMRKCIKEDLKRGEDCDLLDPKAHVKKPVLKLNPKCWHLISGFKRPGEMKDMEDLDVIQIAHRMNRALAKRFSAPHSYQKIAGETQREIKFLRALFDEGFNNLILKSIRGEKIDFEGLPTFGPGADFRLETSRHPTYSMGIRDEGDATMLRKIIALECSQTAQKAVFLVRGAVLSVDSPMTGDNGCHSLSFGTSLFAGTLFDRKACAFHYLRGAPGDYESNKFNDGYVVAIPIEDFNKSPFYIPPVNTLCQLAGRGEDWHGRTKAWKDLNLYSLTGVDVSSNTREYLRSDLPQAELLRQFEKYKKEAFILKKS